MIPVYFPCLWHFRRLSLLILAVGLFASTSIMIWSTELASTLLTMTSTRSPTWNFSPASTIHSQAISLARTDLSGTMCIQKLMPSGFFLFLHAFNLRVYIDWQKHHRRLHAEHLFHRFPPKLFFWYPPYTSSCSYFFSSSLLHPENSFSSGAQERQKKTQKSSPFKAAFFMPSFYRYHSIIHGILCQYYLDCNSVAYRFLL